MTVTVPPVLLRSGSATDTGMRRKVNEDALISRTPVFLVADGMGGHRSGEVASAAAIAEFAAFAGRATVSVAEVRTAFARARVRVETLPDAEGAGTTLTGAVLVDVDGTTSWLVLNLGDSRTYLLSGGEFEQVSVDHSVVQELIEQGELDAETAARDDRRNIITRAIGAGSSGDPDYWLIPVHAGDRLLACSDGLTGELTPARIEAMMRTAGHPQAIATQLVHEALLHGGRDNITAVVVDAVGDDGDESDVDDTLPHVPHAGVAGR
jgi:serine/threonine protein phosphatase PrpC